MQFPDRIGGKGLQQGRSEERRVDERTPGDQNHIHRGKVFHGQVLFEEVKKKQQ